MILFLVLIGFALFKGFDFDVKFKVNSYLAEHMAVSECISKKPMYTFKPYQKVEISAEMDSDFQMKWCRLNNRNITDYSGARISDPRPVSYFLHKGAYSSYITIPNIGCESGNLTLMYHYESYNECETVLDAWCRVPVQILGDCHKPPPFKKPIVPESETDDEEDGAYYGSSNIQAEVSVNFHIPDFVREVKYYDNSTLRINCNFAGPEYQHLLLQQDKLFGNETKTGESYEKTTFGPIQLNISNNGSEYTCLERNLGTNDTYRTGIILLYSGDGTNRTRRPYDEEISTRFIKFELKTNVTDYFTTSQCTSGKPYYTIQRDDPISIEIQSNYHLDLQCRCKIGGLLYLTSSSSWSKTQADNTFRYYHDTYIPNIGYKHGELVCQYNLADKPYEYAICKSHLHILDADTNKSLSDYPEFNSTTLSVIVSSEYESPQSHDLAFTENSSLIVDCNFKNKSILHALLREETNGSTTVLVESKQPFVWSSEGYLRNSDRGTRYICQDKLSLNNANEVRFTLSDSTGKGTGLTLGKAQVAGIVCGCLAFVIVVASAVWCWVRTDKKRKEIIAQLKLMENRPETPASAQYEYVYDVTYEDRIKREKILEEMKAAENDPKRPPPPPVETLPMYSLKQKPRPETPPRISACSQPDSETFNIELDDSTSVNSRHREDESNSNRP